MCKRQGNFPTLRQVIYQGLENYMKDASFWLLHELDTLESKRGKPLVPKQFKILKSETR